MTTPLEKRLAAALRPLISRVRTDEITLHCLSN